MKIAYHSMISLMIGFTEEWCLPILCNILFFCILIRCHAIQGVQHFWAVLVAAEVLKGVEGA